jgi:transcriptional regulator with XRE-family HTH domain
MRYNCSIMTTYKTAALLGRMGTFALADAIGLPRMTVSRWKNSRAWPRAAYFPRLAEALGVTVADLAEAVTTDKMAQRTALDAAQALVNRSRGRKRAAPGSIQGT